MDADKGVAKPNSAGPRKARPGGFEPSHFPRPPRRTRLPSRPRYGKLLGDQGGPASLMRPEGVAGSAVPRCAATRGTDRYAVISYMSASGRTCHGQSFWPHRSPRILGFFGPVMPFRDKDRPFVCLLGRSRIATCLLPAVVAVPLQCVGPDSSGLLGVRGTARRRGGSRPYGGSLARRTVMMRARGVHFVDVVAELGTQFHCSRSTDLGSGNVVGDLLSWYLV